MASTSQFSQLNDETWLRQRYLVDRNNQAEIAREIGCHPQAVLRALRRFGIPSERRGSAKFPQLQDSEWLRTQIEDKPYRQIAEELGASPTAVFLALRRHGIEIPKRTWVYTPERVEAMRRGLREKYPDGRRGPDAANWRGGRRKLKSGYVFLYAPDHPRAGKRGAVQEHILVMEKTLGRYLESGEIVHHKNHVKDDNRPENLYLTKNGTHITEHFEEGKRAAEAEAENARLKALLDAHGIDYS